MAADSAATAPFLSISSWANPSNSGSVASVTSSIDLTASRPDAYHRNVHFSGGIEGSSNDCSLVGLAFTISSRCGAEMVLNLIPAFFSIPLSIHSFDGV